MRIDLSTNKPEVIEAGDIVITKNSTMLVSKRSGKLFLTNLKTFETFTDVYEYSNNDVFRYVKGAFGNNEVVRVVKCKDIKISEVI